MRFLFLSLRAAMVGGMGKHMAEIVFHDQPR
jgi:hypothetical protein